MPKHENRDLTKSYRRSRFVAKLRRLADAGRTPTGRTHGT